MDADSLFYLRSRGLDLAMAKSLLVRGFATECFDTVKNEKVRSFIMKRFDNWLN
ncbi:MAG: SufD family Fe-S cluster assembly protein [Candidatus Neomarinimicrobiota bacterium]|nr:SufD family Fe-S cluster assembly protein [Candidatus Neomarinimicrobiota bacterium]